ncbi:MAG TPA: hypothetical protein VFY01_00125 [Rheinheimera sp.]|nr:hypothetical protein [Rheinheimera sp.]
MGIILLPAFAFYIAAAIFGVIRSYELIKSQSFGQDIWLLLASIVICLLVPTLQIYFRFRSATSLWVFDVPTSLLFNIITAGLIILSFAILHLHLVIELSLPAPVTAVATGVLLGVATGTLLNLIFVEQLLGLDKLPQTH